MDMIRSLKAAMAATILLGVLAGQPSEPKEKSNKPMNQELQLVWTAAGDNLERRRQVHFVYSPGVGLSDLDFHPITDRNWKSMKSPSPDAVARLQVTKQTTVPQLDEVIRHIAEKGGYGTVVVSLLP